MEEPKKFIDKYTRIWRELGLYERFEQVAAIFLSIMISIVIIFAFARLVATIYEFLIFKNDFMDPAVFQVVFAMVVTILIAMEFNHSIVQVVERKQSIVQVRIIVQIAILAIVRKFILIDLSTTPPMTLIGLGIIVFALAALYFTTHTIFRQRPEP